MRNILKSLIIITLLILTINAKAINLQELEKEIEKKGLTVVAFWSAKSPNNSLFQQLYGNAKRSLENDVRFLELDVENTDNYKSRFDLHYLAPVVVLFQDGKELVQIPIAHIIDDNVVVVDEERNKTEKHRYSNSAVSFEDENASKKVVISSDCKYNDSVKFRFFLTPEEAQQRYWQETKSLHSIPGAKKSLKAFWDLRYVNSGEILAKEVKNLDIVNHSLYTGLDARDGKQNLEAGVESANIYNDASIVQAKCIDGTLAAGTTLNLLDSDIDNIEYGGPQSTFMYRFDDNQTISPWDSNRSGNLVIQGYFNKPFYSKYSRKNIGGGVNIGLFLENQKSGLQINYIIGLYAAGKAWMDEKKDLKYDPTTHIVHVSTVVDDYTQWVTKSPKSKYIQHIRSKGEISRREKGEWRDFYRVNISYQNILNVLKELRKHPPKEVAENDFGLNPEDWKVNSIYLQYELEEEGGDAILAGSFKGFEVYITQKPR